MAFSVICPATADEMYPANDILEEMRKEMIDFQKCVAGKEGLFFALTDISAVCGSAFSDCCARIPRPVLREVLMAATLRIIHGNMKVDGKMGHWSMGGFGSRWADMDGSHWGLDYIRCAFYSKKFHKGEWKHDKPYRIQIMCEKSAL